MNCLKKIKILLLLLLFTGTALPLRAVTWVAWNTLNATDGGENWPIRQGWTSSSSCIYSDRGDCFDNPDTGYCGQKTFTFTAPYTTDYIFEFSVLASSGSYNSMWIRIRDNGSTITGVPNTDYVNGYQKWDIDVTGSSWAWRYLTDFSHTDSQTNAKAYSLTAGHTISIDFSGREDGTYMRYIRIYYALPSNTPTYTPTLEPTPSPLGNGLCAYWYQNNNSNYMSDPFNAANQRDFCQATSLYMDWGSGIPSGHNLTNADYYATRYTGQIEAPYTGNYQFRMNCDDGARIYVDGILITDTGYWSGHAAYVSDSSIVNLSSGKHDIIIEYFESYGDASFRIEWSGPGFSWQQIPNNRLYCNVGTPTTTPTQTPAGNGLCGEYHNTTDLSGSVVQRVSQNINLALASGEQPDGSVNDDFSVHWSGDLEIPESADYEFFIRTSDPVRVWINGTQIVNNWTTHGLITEPSIGAYSFSFTTGDRIPVIVEFADPANDAAIQFSWSNNASFTAAVVIPQNQFFSTCIPITPPTPTYTVTPVLPTWYGLHESRRLYGLEYIPFPEQSRSSTKFVNCGTPFNTKTANRDVPKNTARYRIILTGLENIDSKFQVETRIGSSDEAVQCYSGLANVVDTANTYSLPYRPPNLSITYFWLDDDMPGFTDQIDTVGDPRYVPYLDFFNNDAPDRLFEGNYNWFFKNLGDTSFTDYHSIYAYFADQADFNRYNNQVNADVPKMFRIWREAIINSASIFNSLTGYSNYYVGLGQEIGGDVNNELDGGVPTNGRPWNTSAGDKDEITNDVSLIRDNNSSGWVSRPFIGELWPDSAYQNEWSSPACRRRLRET